MEDTIKKPIADKAVFKDYIKTAANKVEFNETTIGDDMD